MEVKTFTYRKSLFGTYYKQGLFNLEKMDVNAGAKIDRVTP